MATAKWKFVGFDLAGDSLTLSELRLWTESGVADTGAVVTSSHAPQEGGLDNLIDGDIGTFCSWPADIVRLPGFWIQLELPEVRAVAAVRMAGPLAAAYPRRIVVVDPSAAAIDLLGDFGGVNVSQQIYLSVDRARQYSVLYLQGSTGFADQASQRSQIAPSGSTVFVDRTQLFNGKPTLKFGGTDFLLAPASSNFAFGTGDFTVAAWIKNPGTGSRFITNRIDGGLAGTWSVVVSPVNLTFTEVVVGEPGLTVPLNIPVDRFFHVAFTRTAGVLRCFLDGLLVGTAANSTNFNSSSGQLAVGRAAPSESGRWTGWVSGLVVCKGLSLWASDFTPPEIDLGKVQESIDAFKHQLVTVYEGDVLAQAADFAKALVAPVGLDMECGGQGSIYGTVELYAQAGNIPLPRRVRLHRSRDGLLVREAWSSAQGEYRFDGISQRYTYDVIAWDHEGLQQSVVANDLPPEVLP